MGFNIQEQVKEITEKELQKIDYLSPKELVAKPVSYQKAASFIIKNHYSHTCPTGITLALGFFYKDIITTCVVYTRPIGRDVASSIWEGGNSDECWELARLFSHDNCPRNTESYCIGKSIKYIKQHFPQIKVLVSYADAKYHHCGYVYQATNWTYIGTGGDKQEFYLKGKRLHTRLATDRYGTARVSKLKEKFGDDFERVELPQKHKYIQILRSKKEIMNKAKFTIYPYPKVKPPPELDKYKKKRKRRNNG